MAVREKYKVLIVDDSVMNRSILADILSEDFDILEAEDGIQAMRYIKKYAGEISLVLLDLVMPNMDGFEVLTAMNEGDWISEIPVIMISAESAPDYIERAYELGVTDFINRPFNVSIVKKRASNTIKLYAKQKNLVNLVNEQIFEREKNNDLMINILSHIVEFRNGESGLHILHVNTITEILLKRLIKKTDMYKLDYSDIANITTASSLHDIGKITIPDHILNKPGRLTPEEYEIIKGHTTAGADMLANITEYINEPLVKTAHEICLYHHERYDGKGYPCGLKGDEIPISAQIVSIADVFDALISVRCYKDPVEPKKALEMIKNGECGVFNPVLMECLEEEADTLDRELRIKSVTERNEKKIKKVTEELLSQEKFSTTNKSINILEQTRIKYEFFASMSNEIQFEYTESPSMLSISEWSANKLGLPTIIVNPSEHEKFMDILGGEDASKYIREMISKTSFDNPTCEFQMKLNVDKQKRWHRFYCRVSWSNDDIPKITGYIGKIVDIEDEYRRLEDLKKRASVDALTNIFNHGHSEKLIKRKLRDGEGHNYALVLFDLDHFKEANDTYGHMFGDKVLKTVANVLISSIRKADIVARIGGDEFLLFFEYTSMDVCKRIIDRIYNLLSNTNCDNFRIMLSMGAATTENVGYDYDKLFNCADTALYHTKFNGRQAYNFYNESMQNVTLGITPIDKN